MPRFQLLIREPGKAPRVVPIGTPLVVGRSRRADVTIEDEEVGREQFRIGVDGEAVFIEAIGKTNRTVLDGTAVAAGQRALARAGAVLQVGRTIFELQTPAEAMPPPPPVDAGGATMIAPPAPAGAGPAELPPEDRTGGYTGPLHTMELKRPGDASPRQPATDPLPGPAKVPGPAPGTEPGMTMAPRSGYRPGQPPPVEDPGLTQPATPPGRKPPVTPAPATPAAVTPAATGDGTSGMTMPPSAGYRPGRSEPATPPRSTQPPPAAPPPPAPLPPPPATPTPAAAAASAGAGSAKARTMVVPTGDLASQGNGQDRADLEARLHQTQARLFLKGSTIKRRLRLMNVQNRVGRAETSDVLLPHDSVSELHAELRFDGQRWLLRDAGSTNGTFADGTPVRGDERPIGRHALLGFGTLRAIFLCNAAGSSPADRKLEERAVQRLVKKGQLGRDTAREAMRLAREDASQSLPELLLMDTPVEPADWSAAITEARGSGGWLARLLGLFRGRRQPPPPLQ